MQNVTVPQKDGEILVSRAGDAPVTYQVKNGVVQVDDVDVDGFLRQIPGAAVSAGKSADKPAPQ